MVVTVPYATRRANVRVILNLLQYHTRKRSRSASSQSGLGPAAVCLIGTFFSSHSLNLDSLCLSLCRLSLCCDSLFD